MSLLDVAKTLTSTSISLWPPTGVTFLSCNTLNNFAWSDKGISEISSKSKVPLSAALKIPVVASGGVSNLDDIKALCEVANIGIRGVITGTAIYKGTLNFKEANELTERLTG